MCRHKRNQKGLWNSVLLLQISPKETAEGG
jgi:hypothetical protein